MAAATLYLGIDGVLHPKQVWFSPTGMPQLNLRGHTLFENNSVLERAIEAYPNTRIVLNTWWVRYVGYQATLRHLPEVVRHRIIGATMPGNRVIHSLPRSVCGVRRSFLKRDIARRRPASPVLVDWDLFQILPDLIDSSVIVDSVKGLSAPGAFDALLEILRLAAQEQEGKEGRYGCVRLCTTHLNDVDRPGGHRNP